MTLPRRSWQRPSALVAVSAAALLGVGLTAGSASAHTPTWSVNCSSVSVDLTAYNGGASNTATITVGGKVVSSETFKSDYHKKLDLPEHSSELTVHLAVKAGDGDQYSYQGDKVAPVCEGAPTPPPSASTPTTPPSEAPTSQAPAPSDKPSQSTSAAAAVSDESSAPADLAETGASSTTPLIAGIAAVVVVAGGGLVFATRKRRAAQH